MVVSVMSQSAHARPIPVYDSQAFRIPLLSAMGEIFQYRFLIWNMVVRDLKIRYKRSMLGFIWVTLNPLLQMAVLYIVFSQVFRFGVQHFAVYLLAGILVWGMFGQGSAAAMAELVGNATILRKLYVPPATFVTAAVGSALVNLIFSLAPFVIITIIGGVYPRVTWAYAIVPMLQVTVFTFGIGLILSALYVFFRDVSEIYQVLLSVFYYATPIFYPVQALPEPVRSWERYNPMYLYIASFRDAVMSGIVPSVSQIAASSLMAVGTLLIGWVVFTRVEKRFVYYL